MSDGRKFPGAVPGGAYEKWLEARERKQMSAPPEGMHKVRFLVGSGDPMELLATRLAEEGIEMTAEEFMAQRREGEGV